MSDIVDKILELKHNIHNRMCDYNVNTYHHVILINKKFKKELSEHYVRFPRNHSRKYSLFGMDCIFIDSSSAVNDVEIVRRY